MRFHLLVRTFFALTLGTAPALACKCAAPPPDAVPGRALSEWLREGDVVFEGKVQSVELKWRLVNAQIGEVISADLEQDTPAMQVSFEVLRSVRENILCCLTMAQKDRRQYLPSFPV